MGGKGTSRRQCPQRLLSVVPAGNAPNFSAYAHVCGLLIFTLT
jgi:hypothetical protein